LAPHAGAEGERSAVAECDGPKPGWRQPRSERGQCYFEVIQIHQQPVCADDVERAVAEHGREIVDTSLVGRDVHSGVMCVRCQTCEEFCGWVDAEDGAARC
jgi:hypothetical protein